MSLRIFLFSVVSYSSDLKNISVCLWRLLFLKKRRKKSQRNEHPASLHPPCLLGPMPLSLTSHPPHRHCRALQIHSDSPPRPTTISLHRRPGDVRTIFVPSNCFAIQEWSSIFACAETLPVDMQVQIMWLVWGKGQASINLHSKTR